MEKFSWEPKPTVPKDLFSVPCLRNTRSHSRCQFQKEKCSGEVLDAASGTTAGTDPSPQQLSCLKLLYPNLETISLSAFNFFGAQALTAAPSLILADCGPWKEQYLFFPPHLSEREIQIKASSLWLIFFFSTIYLKGSGSELRHFCCGGNVWDAGCKPVATNIPAAPGILEWSGRQPRESRHLVTDYLHQRKTSSLRFEE